jgi:hypothetical protein
LSDWANSAEHRAISTATPSCAPLFPESKDRSCTTNSCLRGFRSPTRSLAREYRFCSASRTLSRNGAGWPWLRMRTPPPGPSVTSMRYRPVASSCPPGPTAIGADAALALQLGCRDEMFDAVEPDAAAELCVAELGRADALLPFFDPPARLQAKLYCPLQVVVGDFAFRVGIKQLQKLADRLVDGVLVTSGKGTAEMGAAE